MPASRAPQMSFRLHDEAAAGEVVTESQAGQGSICLSHASRDAHFPTQGRDPVRIGGLLTSPNASPIIPQVHHFVGLHP